MRVDLNKTELVAVCEVLEGWLGPDFYVYAGKARRREAAKALNKLRRPLNDQPEGGDRRQENTR